MDTDEARVLSAFLPKDKRGVVSRTLMAYAVMTNDIQWVRAFTENAKTLPKANSVKATAHGAVVYVVLTIKGRKLKAVKSFQFGRVINARRFAAYFNKTLRDLVLADGRQGWMLVTRNGEMFDDQYPVVAEYLVREAEDV